MTSKHRRSPLALAVLALLAVRPLHPYGVLALLKQWGKGEVINISQRATVYKTVTRLAAAGLIAVRQTERDQQYPERTLYELTGEGRTTLREWLAEMLAGGDREYPEFPAALSFIMLLTPDEALPLLDRRRHQVAGRVAELDTGLAELAVMPGFPQVAVLEMRYLHAMASAELAWLSQVVDELKSKRLDWAHAQLLAYADSHTDEIEHTDEIG
ncbi:MAG TPA: PadR family transcriptional regulator [Pseudonocardiaceae bacterium]|nr:PadR family transcriptional regulator [Pseudonocardiaceae bacterium]